MSDTLGRSNMTRRDAIALSVAAATGLLLPGAASAAEMSMTGRYPDPRVKVLDPDFGGLFIGNTPLLRIHHGNLWAEGPAWSGNGHYLVWSDIPADVQRRWLDEDGHTSELRRPSGKSNGNTFDMAGRQISCQHLHRRVVRYRDRAGRQLRGPAAERSQ
jgi:gluconolactonase